MIPGAQACQLFAKPGLKACGRRGPGYFIGPMRSARFAPLVAALSCAFAVRTFAADAPARVAMFDLARVRLLDGPFKSAQELDRQYLRSLDPERLLLMFRVTSGQTSWAKPLGGWEAPGVELRGHTLGHFLSACSLMVAATDDPELKKKVDFIVATLAKCQAAMPAQGYHEGYLSAFPESLFDRVDARQHVWAPWYTMHKIMAGLLDAHVHAGNAQALEVLTRLAGWVKFRIDRLTPAQMQAALTNEQGGMTEVLANLYAVTRDPDHLRLAEAFNHRAVLDPLARGVDALDGLHANTQIPKITGAAVEYEQTGKAEYRDIARFFWRTVALGRSYAIGGDSDHEHFFPEGDFAKHLGPETAETCNTYNMLKLTEHIFAWEPSAGTMDFYERALYNQILASQDPTTGMFEYFVSMEPGHFKTYSTPENSFWCCVGTGMENHAKYGEAIYAHGGGSLYVNLFIASELKWPEAGMVMRQETAFPEEPLTRLRLRLSRPLALAIRVRRPGWAGTGMTTRLNGAAVAATVDSSGYAAIEREWHDGDTLEIALPLALRTEPLPGNPRIVAIFDGPILLAGALGADGMPKGGAYAVDQKDFVKWPAPAVPTLRGDPASVLRALEPVRGQPLAFSSHGIGTPRDVTLVPFYGIHDQRYTVYWALGPD